MRLSVQVVEQRGVEVLSFFDLQGVRVAGAHGLALGLDLLALLLALGLQLVVLLNALDEGVAGVRAADVFDAHVQALFLDAVAHGLGHDHADGAGVHVEDATGAAVVKLVGHALVDCAVHNHVDVVADFVVGQLAAEPYDAVLTEGLGELLAGFASKTVGVSHGSAVFPLV